MSDNESDPLMNPEFATQRVKIEKFQNQLNDLELKFEKNLKEIELKRRIKHCKIYNEMREVLNTVPHYWLTTFSNHDFFAARLNPDSAKALESLTDIEVKCDEKDIDIYTLTFRFSENEYFTNSELVYKAILVGDSYEVEPIKIDWKSKNLTVPDPVLSEEPFFSAFTDKDSVEFGEVFMVDLLVDSVIYFNNDNHHPDHFDGCCRSEGEEEDDNEEEDDEEVDDDEEEDAEGEGEGDLDEEEIDDSDGGENEDNAELPEDEA